MDREFLDLYNRELAAAARAGARVRRRVSRHRRAARRAGRAIAWTRWSAGLLEGAAFLAARVQLKLKHEFPEFTGNLLEQLVPNYLAPTPSALLAKIVPALRRSGAARRAPHPARLLSRRHLSRARPPHRLPLSPDRPTSPCGRSTSPARSTIAIARRRCRRSACRRAATSSPGCGCRSRHRTAARARGRVPGRRGARRSRLPGSPAAEPPSCRSICSAPRRMRSRSTSSSSPIASASTSAISTNSAIRSSCPAPPELPARRSGSSDDEALLPNDNRVFRGFDLLREYFMFPRKFLGFALTELGAGPAAAARRRRSTSCSPSTRSTRGCRPPCSRAMFALYAAPAVNLFEKTTDRMPVRSNQHEYHVVPDRSRYLDFEPHRMLDVYAHFSGGARRCRSARSIRRRPTGSGGIRRSSTRCGACRDGGPSRSSATAQPPTTPAPTCSSRLVEPAGIEDERERRRAERARALLEPAPDGALAGRRGRRRFPPARRRRARRRLRRRADAAARAGGRRSCAAAARRPTPAP